jgi:serine/threonine-protein kinase
LASPGPKLTGITTVWPFSLATRILEVPPLGTRMAVGEVSRQLQAALVARYTIERELGVGGWATVFLAHDRKHDRKVAVKVLRSDVATALGPGRFLREISIAGRLTHPHILPLYDSGRAGSSLYYVMPFVEGETLRQRLRREHQLPLADTVAIAHQVADALVFAHTHGVVHRDIKPENILLEGDQVYVADFGIARAMQVATGDTLSTPGLAVGTPSYMSPEQGAGVADLDGRSDQYSLGCVVYEMLAGEPPHNGPTAQAILARQQTEPPRSIRVLRPSIPEGVEQAVFTALAKPPADRFPSVSEFVAALDEAAARGRSGAPRSTERLRWAALVAALLVVVASLVQLGRRNPLPQPRTDERSANPTHVAVLYFDDRSEGGTLGPVAAGLTEDLIDALGQVPALHVVSPNGVRPYLDHRAAPDSIGRALQVGTLVGGSVERSGDVLRVSVRLIDAASGLQLQSRTIEYPYDKLFTLQDTLVQEVSRFLRERLGRQILLREGRKATRSVEAWELVQEGEAAREASRQIMAQGVVPAAERALDTADSLFARASTSDPDWPDPQVLRGWLTLDRVRLSESRKPDSVATWFRQGLSHAARALDIRALYPPALELRGTLQYRSWLDSGRDPAGVKGAAEDLRAAAVPANPTQARAWGTLSAILQARGELAEANFLARRAYEADAFLAESPDLLFRLYYTSIDMGKVEEAVRWCDTGLKRFPDDWHFTYCQLSVLTFVDSTRSSADTKVDVSRAWRLVFRLERLGPVEERGQLIPRGHVLVAAVLGRAGMVDSADAVIRRARAAAPSDPELDFYEAGARMLMGDREATLRLLARDLEANPQFKNYMRVYPVFRPLWNDLRFRALMGEPAGESPHQ